MCTWHLLETVANTFTAEKCCWDAVADTRPCKYVEFSIWIKDLTFLRRGGPDNGLGGVTSREVAPGSWQPKNLGAPGGHKLPTRVCWASPLILVKMKESRKYDDREKKE